MGAAVMVLVSEVPETCDVVWPGWGGGLCAPIHAVDLAEHSRGLSCCTTAYLFVFAPICRVNASVSSTQTM